MTISNSYYEEVLKCLDFSSLMLTAEPTAQEIIDLLIKEGETQAALKVQQLVIQRLRALKVYNPPPHGPIWPLGVETIVKTSDSTAK